MLDGQKFVSYTEVQPVVIQWHGQQPVSFFCIGHSEVYWQTEQMFEWTRTICWKM